MPSDVIGSQRNESLMQERCTILIAFSLRTYIHDKSFWNFKYIINNLDVRQLYFRIQYQIQNNAVLVTMLIYILWDISKCKT